MVVIPIVDPGQEIIQNPSFTPDFFTASSTLEVMSIISQNPLVEILNLIN